MSKTTPKVGPTSDSVIKILMNHNKHLQEEVARLKNKKFKTPPSSPKINIEEKIVNKTKEHEGSNLAEGTDLIESDEKTQTIKNQSSNKKSIDQNPTSINDNHNLIPNESVFKAHNFREVNTYRGRGRGPSNYYRAGRFNHYSNDHCSNFNHGRGRFENFRRLPYFNHRGGRRNACSYYQQNNNFDKHQNYYDIDSNSVQVQNNNQRKKLLFFGDNNNQVEYVQVFNHEITMCYLLIGCI